ncbi:MoaF C-terminal domain-containing protein [Kineococcus esterisolvens]|uniref:MoaF C-terminal domain-containing protein n=1 Tax=unclassified Kineococcus TaxID=2621656 RepID=UPI003D7C8A7E
MSSTDVANPPAGVDYPPADRWPTLNALDVQGFSDYNLPDSDALSGRSFRAEFDAHPALSISLDREAGVRLEEEDGRSEPAAVVAPVSVKQVDDGLFLLHAAVTEPEPAAFVIALDVTGGAVTVVRSTLVDASPGSPRVHEDVRTGSLAGRSARHQRTSELVGARVQYVYGPDNAYEHVYLTDSAYTWHCLAGPERGLADTERGRVWKLREDVYLFAWQEKVVPCDGVVAINFRRGRSTGRIWGLDTGTGEPNSLAMGARETLLSRTVHDPSAWA